MEALDELERRLLGLGIRADSFHLGSPRGDRYCKEPIGGSRWAVFFSKRGGRVSYREFPGVAEAGGELERRLLSDLTSRR